MFRFLARYLNQLLGFTSRDGKVRIKDPETGEVLDTFETPDTVSSTFLDNLANRYSGADLTGSQYKEMNYQTSERIAAQEFEAQEAEKSRNFTEYMARNKYAIETQSMQDAGLNPAMVYGGGNLVPTAVNGATANSHPGSGPSSALADPGALFGLLTTLMRLPSEIKSLRAQAAATVKNADANLMNAEANQKNADTNEGRLANEVNRTELEKRRVDIQENYYGSLVKVNEETATKIAQETLNLEKQYQQMDEYLSVAKQNAAANTRQSFAALQSAMAAKKNAETNAYLAPWQRDTLGAQAALTWAEHEGRSIVNKYLPQEKQAQIQHLNSLGYYFNEKGKLCDKEGKLLDAQTTETYMKALNECFSAVGTFIGSVAGSATGAPIGFTP